MMDYVPIQGAPGTCIGCGASGAALGQCLSCGAPVEPVDESWHFDFGWLEGPRLEVGDEVWVPGVGAAAPSPGSVWGVVADARVELGVDGDRVSSWVVDLGGGYRRVVPGRDVRRA